MATIKRIANIAGIYHYDGTNLVANNKRLVWFVIFDLVLTGATIWGLSHIFHR